MKKTLALILAALMLMGTLTGCGAKEKTDDETVTTTTVAKEDNGQEDTTPTEKEESNQEETAPTEKEQTNTKQEAAVGDILDAPEVAFDNDTENLYIYYSYPGDTEDEVKSMEIAVDQVTDDQYVLYSSDGLLKTHEILYEVNESSNTVTKYYKDAFMEGFEPDLKTAATNEEEKNAMLTLLGMFMSDSADYSGMKYRKSDAIEFSMTGDVYVYDVMENGEVSGRMCINKENGLIVKLEDAEGNELFTVQEIKIGEFEMPEYK